MESFRLPDKSRISLRLDDGWLQSCGTLSGVEEMEFEVVLVPQAEGGFTVSVPDLPGVVTEGETKEEALDMARDAIEQYLSVMREKGWPVRQVLRERIAVRLE